MKKEYNIFILESKKGTGGVLAMMEGIDETFDAVIFICGKTFTALNVLAEACSVGCCQKELKKRKNLAFYRRRKQ